VVKLIVITIQRNKRPENESEKSSSSDTGEPESWRLRRRRFRWQQSLHLLHIPRARSWCDEGVEEDKRLRKKLPTTVTSDWRDGWWQRGWIVVASESEMRQPPRRYNDRNATADSAVDVWRHDQERYNWTWRYRHQRLPRHHGEVVGDDARMRSGIQYTIKIILYHNVHYRSRHMMIWRIHINIIKLKTAQTFQRRISDEKNRNNHTLKA